MTKTMTTTATEPRQYVVLSELQLRRLLRAPDRRTRRGPRDAAILAILSTGGLRLHELVGLRVQDVHRAVDRQKIILDVKTAKRKNHRRAVVLVGPWARTVRDYIAKTSPRFWLFEGGRANNEPLTTRTVRRIVKDYLAAVGAPAARCHDLRHTFASWSMRATGGDSWATAQMLGHSSTKLVEQLYSHFASRDANRVADGIATLLTKPGRPAAS